MPGVARLHRETGAAGPGIALASWQGVAEIPTRSGYDEPTILWRMTRADGRSAHAAIGPCSAGAMVVWFVNGRPLGKRDFGDWTGALRWSDQMQAQNWTVGWRLASEYDDPPRRRASDRH